MNPLVSSILKSALRFALGGVVGFLLSKGIMQPGQETAFYDAAAAVVSALVIWWSTRNNVEKHRELNTAAASGDPVSVDVVKEMVKSGVYAPASTPVSVVPKVLTPAERQ